MISQPTIFIVDDDSRLRSSLDLLFRATGYQTKGYASAEDFLNDYDPDWPGCLVLDLCMDGMNGLELQTELKSRGIRLPHILISGFVEVPKVVKALQSGAVDFLEKPFLDEQLLKCVRLAIAQDVRNRHQADHREEMQSRVNSLSPREKEVMDLLVVGKRSKEIAIELKISPKTVDIHRSKVLKKTVSSNVVVLSQMLHLLNE